MSDVMWSGPGRALQFHLDLFARVDRGVSYLEANKGRGVHLDTAPLIIQQRLRLMTSIGDNLGLQLIRDGVTVGAQRDNPAAATTEFNMQRTVGLIQQEHEVLNRGETHYVSHHVATSIEAAADAADDEPLFHTDLPAPNGLIVLEYPLLVPDFHPDTGEVVRELQMPIRAIGWSLAKVHARGEDGSDKLDELDGVFYVLYTDDASFQAVFVPSVQRALPDEYDQFKHLYYNPDREPMWAMDMSGWAFGKSWKRGGEGLPRADYAQGRDPRQRRQGPPVPARLLPVDVAADHRPRDLPAVTPRTETGAGGPG